LAILFLASVNPIYNQQPDADKGGVIISSLVKFPSACVTDEFLQT